MSSFKETSFHATDHTKFQVSSVTQRLERLRGVHFHIGFMLGLGLLLDGMDTVIVAILLSIFVTVFHINFTIAGLLIASGYVGQGIGSLVIGYLSETVGRKRAFIWSFASFGLLSLVAAFSPSFGWLLIARFVQGIGLGGCTPSAVALFTEFVPARKRGKLTSFVQWFYALGFVLAPALALVILPITGAAFGWRLLLAIGALPLLIAPLAQIWVPESVRWLIHRGRNLEAERTIFQLEQSAHRRGLQLEDPQRMAVTAVSQRMAVVAVMNPRSSRSSSLFKELLAPIYWRRTLLIIVQWFVGAFLLGGISSWLPTLYIELCGMTELQAQMLNIVFGVAILGCLLVYGWTSDRLGRMAWFSIGFACAAFGAAWGFFMIGVFHHINVWILASSGMITSLGAYVCVISNFLYTSELYPTRMRSFAISFGKSWSSLANIIAPILIGVLVTKSLGIAIVFLLLCVMALIALLMNTIFGEETEGRILEEIAR